MLTLQRLDQLLEYDPATGFWRWKITRGRAKVGAIAGRKNLAYVQISVDGTLYMAHVLAWFKMTGTWPDYQVDHRDGDGFHNWWDNLRAATPVQNCANRKMNSNNSLQRKGVTRTKYGTFRVRICVAGERISLGCFTTEELAEARYLQAEKEQRGEFARC